MGGIKLFLSDIGGTEIALTVFVMLTAVFGAFIILLFASAGFRSAIFRDQKSDKARAAEKKEEKPKEEAKPARSPAPKRRKPDNDDGVITVPIGMPTQNASEIKERDIMASIRAAGKKSVQAEPVSDNVYVARTPRSKKQSESDTKPLPDTKRKSKNK